MDPEGRTAVSIILPVFNEEQSIERLAAELREALSRMGTSYEIIFIDDGSSDGSAKMIRRLCAADRRIRLISFRKNFGKSAAIACGFREAAGEIIVTMDADGQDDPDELPSLLSELEAGSDVVSGWKKQRRDPLGKVILSRIFNFMVSLLTGIKLHDFNCGFKAYRRQAVENINLHGELHRFIPVLCARLGFRCAERPVNHRPRLHGRSKYRCERLLRGAFDLLTVLFMSRYIASPLHLFGLIGLLCILAGGAMSGYFTLQWLAGTAMHVRPMMVFGWGLILAGIQFFSVGLVAELVVHTSGRDPGYSIKERIPPEGDKDGEPGESATRASR